MGDLKQRSLSSKYRWHSIISGLIIITISGFVLAGFVLLFENDFRFNEVVGYLFGAIGISIVYLVLMKTEIIVNWSLEGEPLDTFSKGIAAITISAFIVLAFSFIIGGIVYGILGRIDFLFMCLFTPVIFICLLRFLRK